jgi:hypothetical protein
MILYLRGAMNIFCMYLMKWLLDIHIKTAFIKNCLQTYGMSYIRFGRPFFFGLVVFMFVLTTWLNQPNTQETLNIYL